MEQKCNVLRIERMKVHNLALIQCAKKSIQVECVTEKGKVIIKSLGKVIVSMKEIVEVCVVSEEIPG